MQIKVMNMEILIISEKLIVKMYKLGLPKRTATAVKNMLKMEEQLHEMMDYIIKNEDIITDHQTYNIGRKYFTETRTR